MRRILAALTISASLLAVALPASAGYVPPDGSYAVKAFANGAP